MGGYSPSRDSGSADAPTKKRSTVTKYRGEGGLVDFVKKGGVTGAVIRAVTKAYKSAKEQRRINKLTSSFASEEGIKPNFTPDKDDKRILKTKKLEGIELAKASTTSATILGPKEIQKKAANTIKGPTTTEMTAAQILLANKRKGRRITNITGATGLAKKYTLSQKTLLG